jgi:hypothetical protein
MRIYNVNNIAKCKELNNNAFANHAAFGFFTSFVDIVFMLKNSLSGPTPLTVTIF